MILLSATKIVSSISLCFCLSNSTHLNLKSSETYSNHQLNSRNSANNAFNIMATQTVQLQDDDCEGAAAAGSSSSVIPITQPACLVILGMAGCGKTTFVQNLVSKVYETGFPYVINLDPACEEVPYPPNIDIRDTINYKEVMERYRLNFNDGVVTTLNLFSTKFNEVIDLVNSEGDYHEYIIVDVPKQMEIFTSTGCGEILTDTLSSRFPTVIVYVMDAISNVCPLTFVFNVIYACSIMHKIKLPFILMINKIDVMEHNYIMTWLNNFDEFQQVVGAENSYITDLIQSMDPPLNQFCKNLRNCGVSARTGEGIPIFFDLVRDAVAEYNTTYEINRNNREEETASNSEIQCSKTAALNRQLEIADIFMKYLSGNLNMQYVSDPDSDAERKKAESFKNFSHTYKKDLDNYYGLNKMEIDAERKTKIQDH